MIFLNFFEDGFVEVKESSGRFELFFFSWRKNARDVIIEFVEVRF